MTFSPEIDRLIKELARLPGLGPRSARRMALFLLKRKETRLLPLCAALDQAAHKVKTCEICGNLDSHSPCQICQDQSRDPALLCVVEDVAGLWAIERSGLFRGHYHVLGGVLSALDGIGPSDLLIDSLITRSRSEKIKETILALGATTEGQMTAHYIAERLARPGLVLSGLARGVPMGGEIDYLDDGTIGAALRSRRILSKD